VYRSEYKGNPHLCSFSAFPLLYVLLGLFFLSCLVTATEPNAEFLSFFYYTFSFFQQTCDHNRINVRTDHAGSLADRNEPPQRPGTQTVPLPLLPPQALHNTTKNQFQCLPNELPVTTCSTIFLQPPTIPPTHPLPQPQHQPLPCDHLLQVAAAPVVVPCSITVIAILPSPRQRIIG